MKLFHFLVYFLIIRFVCDSMDVVANDDGDDGGGGGELPLLSAFMYMHSTGCYPLLQA